MIFYFHMEGRVVVTLYGNSFYCRAFSLRLVVCRPFHRVLRISRRFRLELFAESDRCTVSSSRTGLILLATRSHFSVPSLNQVALSVTGRRLLAMGRPGSCSGTDFTAPVFFSVTRRRCCCSTIGSAATRLCRGPRSPLARLGQDRVQGRLTESLRRV